MSPRHDEWQIFEDRGVTVDRIRALDERLHSDFDPAAWGFAQLAGLGEGEQRAVVSDLILGAVLAIHTNLLEVELHRATAANIEGGGLPMPRPEHWEEDRVRLVELQMHIAGFFRAFGSCLDCLAAAAIGILRIPLSIQKASFQTVDRIESLESDEKWPLDQRGVWSRLRSCMDGDLDALPAWCSWGLEMRHALVHRGRHINLHLPTKPPSDLAIVVSSPEAAIDIARRNETQLHFHRRPWLPEMQHLADSRSASDNWLGESAQLTMKGLQDELTALIDRVAGLLLEVWEAVASGDLQLIEPAAEWQLPDIPAIDFRGIAPAVEPAPITSMHTGEETAKRMELAERVRISKQGS